ncbi:MAG: aspartate aminotransferase family protein, partial [Chloroflexales bacterium]|nr:aspartate aminotransferase family protein [Chloroflexales bacterium]
MRVHDPAAQVAADQAHLLHPQHHPSDHLDPQIWVAGAGALITNSTGQTFLDGLSGMWNVHVGHGRRELVEAAAGQLSRLAFASSYIGDTSLPAIALAERLST